MEAKKKEKEMIFLGFLFVCLLFFSFISSFLPFHPTQFTSPYFTSPHFTLQVLGSGSGFIDSLLAAMRQCLHTIKMDRAVLQACFRAYEALIAFVVEISPR